MRILYITQYFTTPDQPGSLRHYAHARGWTREGHEVTAITSQVVHKAQAIPARYGRRRLVEESVDGIRVFSVRSAATLRGFTGRMANYLSFMLRSMAAGRRISSRFDVVVASSPPLFAAVSGAVLASRWRVPFVMDVRDLWPESAVALGFLRNRPVIWLARRLERWLYRTARHITCVSEGIAEAIRTMRFATRVTVVRNGIDLELFRDAVEPREREEGRPAEIAYAGGHGVNNALDIVIEAAAELRSEPVRFTLIGQGLCTDQLVARAEELRLDNVAFPGLLPRSEVPRRLALADGLIWPVYLPDRDPEVLRLKRGAVPNKLYDYLALGKPLITSVPVDSEAAELIGAFGQGYFAEPTPQDFAAAIRRFLDEGRREDLQSKALKFRETYARDRQAALFLAILERILGEEERARR